MLHNTIHDRQKSKRCVLQFKIPRYKILLRHMTDHEDSFIFGICSRPYIDTSSLIRHLHAHILSFALDCKLCKKKFKTEAEEKFHMYVTPYSSPIYKCFCGMYASTESDLGRHKILYHQVNKYVAEIDHAYALHVPMEV